MVPAHCIVKTLFMVIFLYFQNRYKSIREANPSLKIIPRITFSNDMWNPKNSEQLLSSKKGRSTIISKIIAHLQLKKFNGCVLEMKLSFNMLIKSFRKSIF